VLGIIMVESNGRSEKLPDIMQSSGATRFSISTLVRNENVA
ncbi:glycoside hydrolase, partial [Bacillus cereus]